MPSTIVSAAAITSGGPTQQITGSLGGRTPTGCFVTVTRGTALGNAANTAAISHGASDFTNTWCVGFASEDNIAVGIGAPDSAHVESTTDIIQLFSTNATAIDAAATVTAIANGIELTWSNFPSAAVLVVVRLIYDEEFSVGSYAGSTTLNGTATISGLPFSPTAISFASVRDATGSGVGADGILSLGACAFNADGSLNGQWAITHFDADAPITVSCVGKIARTGVVLERITVNGTTGVATAECRHEVTSRTSDGFVVTTRGTGGFALTGFYAARRAGNLRAWASLEAVATSSTGDKTVTPGFPPGEIVISPTITAGASIDTLLDTESSAIGIGANASDATSKNSGVSVEDAATTTDTYSLTSNAHAAAGVVGSTDWIASVTARATSSFTFNVSKASVLGIDALVGFLVLEQGFAPGWIATMRRWRRQLGRL